jgi:hypothetical protein
MPARATPPGRLAAKIIAVTAAAARRPSYRDGVSAHDDGEGLRPGIPPTPGPDVLEHGGRPLPSLRWWPSVRWWPSGRPRPGMSRTAILLTVAGLLIGAVAGYTAGDRHGRTAAAPSAGASTSPASAATGYTLGQSGGECSAQRGSALQLGIQVTNESSAPLTLLEAAVTLPLRGLRVTAVAWGPCGQVPTTTEDPPLSDATERYLPPGASSWLNVTVAVLVTCPGPLPVQFTVTYKQDFRASSVRLPGFADLGQIPYRSCPVS